MYPIVVQEETLLSSHISWCMAPARAAARSSQLSGAAGRFKNRAARAKSHLARIEDRIEIDRQVVQPAVVAARGVVPAALAGGQHIQIVDIEVA